ncbi:glycoside hydrolase family 18 protein [Amanita thiersii Skay4041]|uniref:Glycoside hydrolase family 18 protein n=1 Tax=Amanita thiersii Skay4041 TaxID=703135 RepID=A0A2A9NQK3_9AGAR|nr:glycoside hydrolase family 18 protein [Amanita thiersii Skay4041]
MAYYPDWAADTFPPEKIDFSFFDWIDFAFAIPDQTFNLTWDDPDNAPALLHRLVTTAHANCKKVKLSIGGWTGSKYFSSAVATTETRERFTRNIISLYNTFNLDGVDIDWEYPGRPGDAENRVSSKDSENFLLFLQLLRTLMPPCAIISAAVASAPFVDATGQPIKDMTKFAAVLNWIVLMNYDVWGSSQDPGPNAPMYNACKNSSQPDASAVAAYKTWVASGFSVSQLILGLPSYGYISNSRADSLRTRAMNMSEYALPSQRDRVKVVSVDGSDSQILFRQLLEQGALVRVPDEGHGTVSFNAASGFERRWDNCSETPFLHSSFVQQVITYDDPLSLSLKARFIQQMGMLGANLFDIHGDTDEWDLTKAITHGLGLSALPGGYLNSDQIHQSPERSGVLLMKRCIKCL